MSIQNKVLTIGIWGNYNYGNWGDDLMAIIIAEYIKKNGHRTIVYRLDEDLSKEHNIPSERSVDKLVRDSDFLLIGGGGMLVGNSLVKRLLSPIAKKFERDFKDLNKSLKAHGKKIYPITIGGEEKMEVSLSKSRSDFFKSDSVPGGTLRLKGDIPFVHTFNKNFIYYPDILFDIKNQFELGKTLEKPENEIWMGVNLINKNLKNEKWHLDLIEIAQKRNNLKVFFIKTHLPKYKQDYEFVPNKENDNVKIHQYTSVEGTLSLLKNLDLVISSKLHLGLTALSLGTPFFSYKGKGKTISALNSIGGSKVILKEDFNINNFLEFYSKKENRLLSELYDLDKYNYMTSESKKHYDFIKELVERHMLDN
ncbi:MAG: hypothetical protein CMP12_19075 [Zunongwangia sp.]|uniref:Polysaccharide pyruvyl transferase domain-containing protein n=1 Tax=Zunongwangia profunda TaxID=398743 RepID=A0A3D5IY24_9FLAO|nr:polysaccharide pyruvyl transferase family protein [Zunongwangia profunda]MAB91631.1 hypothetical protein [Planctomycetota bacterium]MAO37973.1 hypothetical protein [Zunongwangia sp.]MAS72478.1 hypothetical protein [Zunongwangia sp.]HCV79940.1 hypothetical protein [Zunongwangia profunda]|tara:strand:- start:1755 stop:2852 length:1098 start_codon:yes stop_codon:yes gene_type:complete